jgi:transglutaminase-like putative cysteine protease
MILTVNHETVYRYDAAVNHSTQYLRLTPPDGEGQRVLDWKLELPVPATTARDAFGNILHVLTMDMPHSEIRIRATGIVETDAGERSSAGAGDPRPYLRVTPLTEMSAAMMEFAAPFRLDITTLDGVEALMLAVLARVAHEQGISQAVNNAAEIFAVGMGNSHDYAHVFLACCRYLGVPARYVSGYMHEPSRWRNGTSSHAWVEVWLQDCWWGFDVANGCRAGALHLKLAVGMDYMDACPVRGVRRGGGGEVWLSEGKVMPSQPGMSAEHIAMMIEQQQQQQQ